MPGATTVAAALVVTRVTDDVSQFMSDSACRACPGNPPPDVGFHVVAPACLVRRMHLYITMDNTKCFQADNEFDRLVGPECPLEMLSRLAMGRTKRVMPGWLREAHEAEVSHHQTAGNKLAGAERAYEAALAEWADLPSPVFDELAQEGLRLMAEGTWEAGLTEYVEAALEAKLGRDLVVEFHGRNARCMVKAGTKFGRRWLTAADGALGKSMREVLVKLWAVAPEPTEAETLESAALLEQEAA